MAQFDSHTDSCRPDMQPTRDDRRELPRLRCKGVAEVRYLDLDIRVTGALIDLSVKGCCIESRNELPAAENPVVEVRLDVNGSRFCVAGVVRNVRRERRAGIVFTSMTSRKAEQIKQLVSEVVEHRTGQGRRD